MRFLLAVLLALPLRAQTEQRLDEYLNARTALGQFSGSVLVAHEGKVLLRKGYGYANLEHLVANGPETKFEIASLTKGFTAFAIHDLAKRGKLRLDAPLCDYIDPCTEAWKPVTVAQLVHHVSGIPDYEETLADASAKEVIDWARQRPLDFAPGTKFGYSNTGYLVLGSIVERLSGRTYEEYLRERVFTPLQMTATMHIDRTRPQRHRADGYTHQAPLYDLVAGLPLTSPHLMRVTALRHEAPQADGGLLSTIDDLHVWTRFVLARPELLEPHEPGGYAYGWYAGKRFGRTLYSHTGVLPGMVSAIHLYPETNTTLIILCNLDRARLANITRDLTHTLLGRPYDVPRSHVVTTIDAEKAARLLGDYELSDGRTMHIRHDAKNGWLEAEVKGQFVAGLLPESDTVFYAPMWEGTVTFTDGALVVRQTGADIRGERLR